MGATHLPTSPTAGLREAQQVPRLPWNATWVAGDTRTELKSEVGKELGLEGWALLSLLGVEMRLPQPHTSGTLLHFAQLLSESILHPPGRDLNQLCCAARVLPSGLSALPGVT